MAKSEAELITEVTEGGKRSLWDARDQGRLAYHRGEAFESNPHKLYPGYFHANMAEWERGWQQEAQENQDETAR